MVRGFHEYVNGKKMKTKKIKIIVVYPIYYDRSSSIPKKYS